MKTFKDSATGTVVAFEDYAVITLPDGGYKFVDINGKPLPNVPTTLQPYTPPTPTATELLSDARSKQAGVIRVSASTAEHTPLAFTNAAGIASTFPMDPHSWTKYLGAYTRYVVHGVALPSNFAFSDTNGRAVAMTVADIDAFFGAGTLQIETALTTMETLLSQIEAATTVTAVQSITW